MVTSRWCPFVMVEVDISDVLRRQSLLGGAHSSWSWLIYLKFPAFHSLMILSPNTSPPRHLPIILPPHLPPFHIFLRLRPSLLPTFLPPISVHLRFPHFSISSPSASPSHMYLSNPHPFYVPIFIPPLPPVFKIFLRPRSFPLPNSSLPVSLPSTYPSLPVHPFRYSPPMFNSPSHIQPPPSTSPSHIPTSLSTQLFLIPSQTFRKQHNCICLIVICNISIYLNMSQCITFTLNVFFTQTRTKSCRMFKDRIVLKHNMSHILVQR